MGPDFGPSLGIYVQVPFCASKCSFCNFSSRVERSAIFAQYTRTIQLEAAGWRNFFAQRGISPEVLSNPADSIYFGGGTPTLLGEQHLGNIVGALKQHPGWSREIEFTVEITPGSADAHLLRALRELGVNRLSIGAQTLEDHELRAVGRLHSAADTAELARQAREAGFENISLDLIAGLPHQTRDSFRRSLEGAMGLRPEHVSLYLFEVDEKSRLGREVLQGGSRYDAATVPDEDFMADAYAWGCAFLTGRGYVQYEISNFALPGYASRHNQKYWRLEPYIGLGAGAHSFCGGSRWSNLSDVRCYLEKLEAGEPPVDDFRILTSEAQLEEFFFLGLRQMEGIDLAKARQRWGSSHLGYYEARIRDLVGEGWLVMEGDRVHMAPHACLVSNEIFQQFLSE
jgi:oxygen-independent coproporphyrinogen-3 oxidase